MWIIDAEDNNDLDFNVCEKVVLILDISDTDFNVCEKVVLILDISDLWGLNSPIQPSQIQSTLT